MIQKKYNVKGMSCSACSSAIENKLNNLNGICKASVSLLNNTVDVEYDDEVIREKDIIDAINSLGYQVVINENKNIKKDNKNPLIKALISIVLSIILMFISMGKMFKMPYADFFANHFYLNFSIQLIIASIVYLINRKFFIQGFKALLKFHPNMDSLVALGSSAAYLYSVLNLLFFNDFKHLYFEGGAMILSFVSLGKYLEARSKNKTKDSIVKLLDLQENKVTIIRNNKYVEVNFDDVKKGDNLLIRHGEKIPVDGVLKSDIAIIDESLISGESMPVNKIKGDELISGTINLKDTFIMEATKVQQETSLQQMIKLVQEASDTKPQIAKVADKISLYFVPTVIVIAIITFISWLIIGKDLNKAVNFAICVLVVSCPCALGLATPVSIMASIGSAATNGILIKNGDVLETSSKSDIIFLDKTGTITIGKPYVVKKCIDNIDYANVCSIEKLSNHPLSKAISSDSNADINVYDYQEIVGKGVIGKVNGDEYIIGNLNLMNDYKITINEQEYNNYTNEALTSVIVAKNKKYIGIIGITDPLKSNSKQAIKLLKNMNYEVILLSGDCKVVADKIGKDVGVDKIISGVKPQEKQKYIKLAQHEGKKVIMVGDGANDALALMSANVGIGIGSGSDIAINSADAILRSNNLLDLVNFLKLSKDTLINIKENLFWALIYNVIMIPLAAGLFYKEFGLMLSPMLASIAMSCSSLFVVTNALRLRYLKKIKEDFKMKKYLVLIDGMMCQHCVKRVSDALNTISGCQANVDLDSKSATISLKEDIDIDEIKNVIEQAGYNVKNIKEVD